MYHGCRTLILCDVDPDMNVVHRGYTRPKNGIMDTTCKHYLSSTPDTNNVYHG